MSNWAKCQPLLAAKDNKIPTDVSFATGENVSTNRAWPVECTLWPLIWPCNDP